jgi:hypothetical protein
MEIAPWTADNQPCVQALQVLFDVSVERFPWSGSNSTRARAKAAQEFATFVNGLGRKYDPGTRMAAITHSHGGNVALLAMKDPGVASQLGAVVTIATPFIHLRAARKWPEDLTSIAIVTLVIPLLIVGVGTVGGLGGVLLEQWRLPQLLLYAPLVAFICVAGGLAMNSLELVSWLKRRQDELVANLRITPYDGPPVLAVPPAWDEPLTGLKASDAVVQPTLGRARSLEKFNGCLGLLGLWSIVLGPVIALIVAGPLHFLGLEPDVLVERVMFAFRLVPAIFGAIGIAVVLSVAVRWLSYGESPLMSLLLDVRASNLPPKGVPVSIVRYRTTIVGLFASLVSLRHWEAYGRKDVMEDVARRLFWLL